MLWTLNRVTITRRSETAKAVAKYTSKWLDVEYTWGPDTGKRYLSVDRGGPQLITRDEADDWLYHPLKTYRRKYVF